MHGAILPPLRQQPVNLICKRLSVCFGKSSWPTCLHPAAAKAIHEISHGESFLNISVGQQFTSRINDGRSLGDDLGGKRNIGGDDQITRMHLLRDALICNIEAAGNLLSFNPRRWWHSKHPIGNQREGNLGSGGDAIKYFLDDYRTCISVNPNSHGIFFPDRRMSETSWKTVTPWLHSK